MAYSATVIELERTAPKPSPISPATGRIGIWSTDAIRAPERFSYWRDAVCRALLNISVEAPPEAPPERFCARMTARASGSLRFSIAESTGYHLVRTRRDIASADADHHTIYLKMSGDTVITQGDERAALAPNDIAVLDGRAPFRASLAGRCAILVLPRALIDRRAPWLRGSPLRKLAAHSPFVDLARRHMLLLSADDSTLSESETSLLTENLCNLLALASASGMEPRRLQPELQTAALLAYCRQHLHDAELSPQQAADHLGISLRTLHSRFRQIGQSFSRWLLEHRLEACQAALRDDNQRTSNISEIAYRWGFNDLSHFNKAFRAHFGMSPREWRNGPETPEGPRAMSFTARHD